MLPTMEDPSHTLLPSLLVSHGAASGVSRLESLSIASNHETLCQQLLVETTAQSTSVKEKVRIKLSPFKSVFRCEVTFGGYRIELVAHLRPVRPAIRQQAVAEKLALPHLQRVMKSNSGPVLRLSSCHF